MQSPVGERLVLVLLGLGLFFGGTAGAGEGVARIRFDSKGSRFPAAASGDVVEGTIPFRNEGDGVLRIYHVEASCSCTVVGASEEVAPGGTGAIRYRIETKGTAGQQMFSLTVFSNDESQADQGEGATMLTIEGEIVPTLQAVPPMAYFPDSLAGKKASTSCRIVAIGGMSPEDLRVETCESPVSWVACELQPAPDAMPPGVDLRITISGDAPVGSHDLSIRLRTNHPRQPLFEVPLHVQIHGSIYSPLDQIFLTDMGPGPHLLGREQVIQVLRVGEGGIPLREVVANPRYFDVKTKEVVPGRRLHVTVRLRDDAPSGPFGERISILLDSPETPEIVISAMGSVSPRLLVSPSALWAKTPGRAGNTLGIVTYVRRRPGPLHVLRTRAEDERFGIEILPEEENGRKPSESTMGMARLRIFLAKELPVGRFRTKVVVETDVPGENRIDLRVDGLAAR